MAKNIIPAFPEFSGISCDFYDEIKGELRLEQPEISEHSPGFIYGYREVLKLSISRLNGNIILRGFYDGHNLIVSPIGKKKPVETFTACIKHIKDNFGAGRIGAIPKTTAMELAGAGFKLLEDRDDFDYIYDVKQLINLSGEKYHSKKNLINNFMKRYLYEYRVLDSAIIPACLTLQEKWCDLKDCREETSKNAEDRMVLALLNNFSRLQLFGGAILIDGKVQAFTLLEELNKTTALAHVEKANTEYKGIYQAINQFTAEKLLSKYEFVNREQDVGEPGLRKAKLSYNPTGFAEKYFIEVV